MAGRMQLAATGIQDRWLTGEPQISYFVTVFKRHTRFSTESVELPFAGDNAFGSSVECRIPNNIGDLVRGMILKVKLGNLSPHVLNTTPYVRYYYNVPLGKSIIKYADLLIGGQVIERLTGEYIYMYDQLHSNKDDVDQTLYYMNGHNETLTVSDTYNTFYVNLPFYFYRNPSLAVPVCALTKQLVEVRVTFRDVDDDVTFKYTIPSNGSVQREKTTEGSIKSASLITDFYFITEDEKNFLLTRPMEYVITQLQKSTMQFKPGELKKSVLLKFENPVKELLFLAKEETGPNFNTEDRLLNTSASDQSFSAVLKGYTIGSATNTKRSDHRALKNIKLECNGTTVFDHSGQYLAYQQSLRYHTGCPDPGYEFYTYSFALKPDVYYPTGQLNMSRIIHKKLDIELDTVPTAVSGQTEATSKRNINVDVYAHSYNVLYIASGIAGLKF
tara:strand:- start:28 stop:1359 length:1332 start_codon:yes stop_codon:yes gene_type:complete